MEFSLCILLSIKVFLLVECGTRFTHANRHCPDHPNHALVRDEANMPTPTFDAQTTSPQAIAWLQRFDVNIIYIMEIKAHFMLGDRVAHCKCVGTVESSADYCLTLKIFRIK